PYTTTVGSVDFSSSAPAPADRDTEEPAAGRRLGDFAPPIERILTDESPSESKSDSATDAPRSPPDFTTGRSDLHPPKIPPRHTSNTARHTKRIFTTRVPLNFIGVADYKIRINQSKPITTPNTKATK